MLDWLIIGGGVHGTYLANFLLHHGHTKGRKRVALRVLDPERRLMARWHRFTTNTGMDFLRSPRVHHIDISSNSLHEFAMRSYRDFSECYTEPYFRPSLELFHRHSERVIERRRLNHIFIRGKATQLKEFSTGISISSTIGTLKTRRLLLCIGLSDQPLWPDWSKTLVRKNGRIHHIFDRDNQLFERNLSSRIAVVGGGLTAVQTALYHSRNGCEGVTIISRHPQRTHQFDADPGWIGLKFLNDFHTIDNYEVRRTIINRARNWGSVPADVFKQLKQHVDQGRIRIIRGEVIACKLSHNNTLRITLLNGQTEPIVADRIILATGFDNKRPGGEFIDQAMTELNLPHAGCGYPIIDRALSWHPRIFVSGPLSELEIGPVARNIIGARLAGKRLMSIL